MLPLHRFPIFSPSGSKPSHKPRNKMLTNNASLATNIFFSTPSSTPCLTCTLSSQPDCFTFDRAHIIPENRSTESCTRERSNLPTRQRGNAFLSSHTTPLLIYFTPPINFINSVGDISIYSASAAYNRIVIRSLAVGPFYYSIYKRDDLRDGKRKAQQDGFSETRQGDNE